MLASWQRPISPLAVDLASVEGRSRNDFQVSEIKDHPWWSNEECSERMQQVVKKPWIERGASTQKIWGSRGRGFGLRMNGHHLLNYTYYVAGFWFGIPVSVFYVFAS
jgi:hypothetical protein